jgi:hypothetical protein
MVNILAFVNEPPWHIKAVKGLAVLGALVLVDFAPVWYKLTHTHQLMARFRTDGMNECSAHPSRFGSTNLSATWFSGIGWTRNEPPEMDNNLHAAGLSSQSRTRVRTAENRNGRHLMTAIAGFHSLRAKTPMTRRLPGRLFDWNDCLRIDIQCGSQS